MKYRNTIAYIMAMLARKQPRNKKPMIELSSFNHGPSGFEFKRNTGFKRNRRIELKRRARRHAT